MIRYLAALGLRREVEPDDLPLLDGLADDSPNGTRASAVARKPTTGGGPRYQGVRFHEAKRRLIDHFERRYLCEALQRNGGNIAHAARESGKARRAFFELMRKHDLTKTHDRREDEDPEPASSA